MLWIIALSDRDDRNETQIIYGCRSSYALSKIIVDNGVRGSMEKGERRFL